MTYREEAREAWRQTHLHDTKNPAAVGMLNVAADAASDVWEPVVKELLEAVDRADRRSLARSGGFCACDLIRKVSAMLGEEGGRHGT